VLVVVGLVAVALIARWFAGAGAVKNAKAGRPPAAVAVAKVDLADMPVIVSAIGTVTPIDTATVRTTIAGNVFSVLFTEGQRVGAGQVIAQIDPRPYRLTLAQAEGTLARDVAQLNAARIDLKRYETLAGQDSVAGQQVDTQRATVGQLTGTVAADRAAVGTARLNLAYTAVKAPFAGRIGLKQVSVGSYATPSDATGIAIVTRIDPIDVVFSVPQGQLAAIQRQAGSGAGLPVSALDQDGKTEIAKGRFSTFDNQIDTTTGTVKAKAHFANPNGAAAGGLFPNQFVNVRMLVDTLRNVPVVPVSALRHGAPGDFVFVVQPNASVKLVVVKPGPSDGTRTAILSGLSRGATVVSEGADGLDDGSKVRLPAGGKDGASGGASGAKHSHKTQAAAQ
jgi:multidrug efflux system membrane fusion protein